MEDRFGRSIALEDDWLVVSSASDDSGTADDPTDDSVEQSGAVHVFRRSGDTWPEEPESYLKASTIEADDQFGWSVALSGTTLVVSGYAEDSATDVVLNGDESNNDSTNSGAAYVFRWNGTAWDQAYYLKSPAPDASDFFGFDVAASGTQVAVSSRVEDGSGAGVGGDPTDNGTAGSGAVFLY